MGSRLLILVGASGPYRWGHDVYNFGDYSPGPALSLMCFLGSSLTVRGLFMRVACSPMLGRAAAGGRYPARPMLFAHALWRAGYMPVGWSRFSQ